VTVALKYQFFVGSTADVTRLMFWFPGTIAKLIGLLEEQD